MEGLKNSDDALKVAGLIGVLECDSLHRCLFRYVYPRSQTWTHHKLSSTLPPSHAVMQLQPDSSLPCTASTELHSCNMTALYTEQACLSKMSVPGTEPEIYLLRVCHTVCSEFFLIGKVVSWSICHLYVSFF